MRSFSDSSLFTRKTQWFRAQKQFSGESANSEELNVVKQGAVPRKFNENSQFSGNIDLTGEK
jgi:hypothetical protein